MLGSKKPLALLVTVVALVGSACVPAFTPSSPSISGDAVVGGTVQVSTEWSVQPSETMYSWFACEDNSQDSCSEIVSGMGQSSISLDASAEGKWVFATVRGTNVAGNAEASTDLLGPVAQASNDCTIAGTAVETVLSKAECDGLLALYNATPNPNPADFDGWNTATDPCGWAHTGCNQSGLSSLSYPSSQLASLPPEIGNLTNLTGLTLYSSQLVSLPAEFGNLTKLTYLGLSGNQLVSLPAEIGSLSNLSYIDLGANQLVSLPAEIWNLASLDFLGLYGNQLVSLPAEIGNLTNLTSIGLSNNQLVSLPIEIGNLTNLTSLYLGANQLESLPAEFGNLTNLTLVGLTGNQLVSLPDEFGNLTNLNSVYLRSNVLTGDLAVPLGGLQSSVSVVDINDGANGNNCLTSSDTALQSLLNQKNPGWDECD